jgi:hypothetical protein
MNLKEVSCENVNMSQLAQDGVHFFEADNGSWAT